MRGRVCLSALAVACVGPAGWAAVPSADGTPLSGTSASIDPHLAGTVLQDAVRPFSYSVRVTPIDAFPWIDLVTGTVSSRVIRSVDGTLDFQWQIDLSQGQLTSFTLDGFDASRVHADWRSDLGGDRSPSFAGRVGEAGVEFGFFPPGRDEFDPMSPLRPGERSSVFFLDTTATRYASLASYRLDSNAFSDAKGRSVAYPTFGPVPIPEPQTWALMLAGLGVLAGTCRRRRAARPA